MLTRLLKNYRVIGTIETSTLKRDEEDGRELGNAVCFGSDDGSRWEQDMIAPDGISVTVVYQFAASEMHDDDDNPLDAEELPWDDEHISHVEPRPRDPDLDPPQPYLFDRAMCGRDFDGDLREVAEYLTDHGYPARAITDSYNGAPTEAYQEEEGIAIPPERIWLDALMAAS